MASRRRGVQVEITVSLAIVMATATGLLAAFFIATHAAQTERLQPLLGHALADEARRLAIVGQGSRPGAAWFIVARDGGVRAVRNESGASAVSTLSTLSTLRLDRESHALVVEARAEGRALLRAGVPWEPIRFAAPVAGPTGGEVAVALIAPAVPRLAVGALLVADGLAFTILGAYLLRRRVVTPLRRLAEGARMIGKGGPGARVRVDGVGEVIEVGHAFNEMSEALEIRSNALEKAVAELRSVNQRLQRARDGLDRAERMAAVGHLAAGVAHEVGNPMGAVLAFLDLAQRDPTLSEQGRSHLARAATQGERVREILRQLLDFSRPPRAAYTSVDLAACAEQAVGLVQAQARYRALTFEIDVASGAPLGAVRADESLVAQVLLNLLLNAADAARASEEPRVRVSLLPSHLKTRDGEHSTAARQRRAYDAVECRVEDNGPGVAPEDQERIFDPFFTTKPPGEGTGLGLANALRLTEELEGALELAETELGGAAFVLRLPLAERTTREGVRLSPESRTP